MTSHALSPVTIRLATPADATLLASLAATAFSDTFAAGNTADDMALYMAGAFGESIQHAELSDPRHIVFLAERDGEAVGYVMLREGPTPNVVVEADALEIARLYAVKHLIGAGIGATLMQRSLDEAAARGKSTIWLGVWERNARAIAFYERWGFADVGSQSFILGRDRQTDRVMARRVAERE
jgi:ribosomal protein S18 acetylase RimI-like enzyme